MVLRVLEWVMGRVTASVELVACFAGQAIGSALVGLPTLTIRAVEQPIHYPLRLAAKARSSY